MLATFDHLHRSWSFPVDHHRGWQLPVTVNMNKIQYSNLEWKVSVSQYHTVLVTILQVTSFNTQTYLSDLLNKCLVFHLLLISQQDPKKLFVQYPFIFTTASLQLSGYVGVNDTWICSPLCSIKCWSKTKKYLIRQSPSNMKSLLTHTGAGPSITSIRISLLMAKDCSHKLYSLDISVACSPSQSNKGYITSLALISQSIWDVFFFLQFDFCRLKQKSSDISYVLWQPSITPSSFIMKEAQCCVGLTVSLVGILLGFEEKKKITLIHVNTTEWLIS